MKFIKSTISKVKKGDYICYISPRTPSLKLFGYVRIIGGLKVIQSKNAIQTDLDPIYHFKPGGKSRFFKSDISKYGQIQLLVD